MDEAVVAPDRIEALRERVRSLGSAVVAYSGGVDSALLLAVSAQELGEGAVGLLARSPSLAAQEEAAAVELARRMGARLEVVDSRELARPGYVANGPDRCFHCKGELFDLAEVLRARLGLACIAYGANADDRGDHRPGMAAARERGIRAPLLEAGMGKEAVRSAARHLGLSVWDKPSLACLASRIPYGTPVTPEALSSVDRAEVALRRLGFPEVRVRHHGDVARIEVPPGDVARLASPVVREAAVRAVREAGFAFAAVDLEGYRSGSLNRTLGPRVL
ncbi:MAG: ATP-dependent sacrificial sulfur transferase LarE [Planctomycetes bacterium]|nr:ATP-dependent sacrificial sulfur transferase LarE [Planctomycetota bacterium]